MKQYLFFLSAFIVCLHANAQNIGIGTDNPVRAKLEVYGAVGSTSAIFGGESSGISLQRNWPSIGFNQYYNNGSRYMANGFAGVQHLDPNSGAFTLDLFASGTAGGECLNMNRSFSFHPNGAAVIGPNYFNSNLTVWRGGFQEATTCFMGSTYHSYFNLYGTQDTYIRGGRANSKVIINDIPGGKILMSGKIGINTSTPGTPLEIYQDGDGSGNGISLVNPGNNYDSWQQYTDGGVLFLSFRYNAVGWFSPSNGSYNNFSDARLKRDVHALPAILNKVMELKPVGYEMIKNNPKHEKSIGFIAQDVNKLFPELVTIATDTVSGYGNINGLHSVNYTGFTVLAIKAIQEQQQLIDELKKTVTAQQQLNENLLKRVEALEEKKTIYLNNQNK
jgi:hypothetical protein